MMTEVELLSYNQVFEISGQRLRELVDNDHVLIGYLYPHAPIEMLIAHRLTPSLIWAKPGVTGGFESSLQTFACAYARNIFSQRASEQLSLLAGILFPSNTCDSLQNVADVWRFRYPEDRIFRLTYPVGNLSDASVRFLAEELRILSGSLEAAYGNPLSEDNLLSSIELVKEFRNAAQILYSSRLLRPKLVSYKKLSGLIREFLTAPSKEGMSEITSLAASVERELEEAGLIDVVHNLRDALLNQNLEGFTLPNDLARPRVAIIGGMVEPQVVAQLIETIPMLADDMVVMDLLSFGFKTVFTPSPSKEGDHFEEMARAILKAPGEPTQEGLRDRQIFLKQVLTQLGIDGLVICEQSFCDPDEFEAPSLEKAASDVSVPTVRLPVDPELSDYSRLEVRIQSFLETIEQGEVEK
ncbi:MAG: 2-hydroxyacyl-CoA dehydratase [Candidatus Thorarchaeota archaeon]|jgi:benzoyl-CoA reductase/2-hydroxyglutaryl-CoA dehydratase subunit BcrC/BadD/HgdB